MAKKVVNIPAREWAHLQSNRHCRHRVDRHGTHRWENAAGALHRVDANGHQDGPALIRADGYQAWYCNGDLHRADASGFQDGPASIAPDKSQTWWFNGQIHRVEGPASIGHLGEQHYYLDNVGVTQEDWSRDRRVVAYQSLTPEEAEQCHKRL